MRTGLNMAAHTQAWGGTAHGGRSAAARGRTGVCTAPTQRVRAVSVPCVSGRQCCRGFDVDKGCQVAGGGAGRRGAVAGSRREVKKYRFAKNYPGAFAILSWRSSNAFFDLFPAFSGTARVRSLDVCVHQPFPYAGMGHTWVSAQDSGSWTGSYFLSGFFHPRWPPGVQQGCGAWCGECRGRGCGPPRHGQAAFSMENMAQKSA